jgi:delta 1-pyrroline-5-carboxylate dehydrogenase
LNIVDRARQEGGRIVTGGERMGGEAADGFYLPITIVADVANDSNIAQYEVFGPVLSVTPFDTEEEAIELANGTAYGLGGYIHTQNLGRAHRMAAALDSGMIHVNGAGEGMTPCAPFGGMKQSAYAIGLANAGASVAVADINGEGAQRVADEITATGGKAIAVQADITDQKSVAAMVQAVAQKFGGVDILVNNAALMAELTANAVSKIPLDEWNRILNVNLTGALLCAQAVVPLMRARRRAHHQPDLRRRLPRHLRLRHRQTRPRRPHHRSGPRAGP